MVSCAIKIPLILWVAPLHNGKIGQEELKYPLMSLDGVHIAVVRRPQPTFTGELLPEPNLPFVRI